MQELTNDEWPKFKFVTFYRQRVIERVSMDGIDVGTVPAMWSKLYLALDHRQLETTCRHRRHFRVSLAERVLRMRQTRIRPADDVRVE